MPSRFDFSEEAARTNAEFDVELARLTPFTAEELASLVPTRADKEQLKELIEIVRGSANRNTRVAELRARMHDLGEVAMKVMEKFLG